MIKCFSCGLDKLKFISVPDTKGFFDRKFHAICETCAEAYDPEYAVLISPKDNPGSCLITKGTLADCLRALGSAVQKYGTNEVSGYLLLKVPGKYRFHSSNDRLKFGKKIPFSIGASASIQAYETK